MSPTSKFLTQIQVTSKYRPMSAAITGQSYWDPHALLKPRLEQSDQGLYCLPFRLHRLDSLLYGRAT